MKIRTNFVSNSSSSSFIAFVNKKVYDDILLLIKNEKLKEYLNNHTFKDVSYRNYMNLTKDSMDDIDTIRNGYYLLQNKLSNNVVMLFQGGLEYDDNEDNSNLFGCGTILKTILSFTDDSNYNYLELI